MVVINFSEIISGKKKQGDNNETNRNNWTIAMFVSCA